ncbi:tubulin-tyrosine ligase family protein (macronuclear) [Tetrahymena thermophila SB210]|uniref:Tubulin-tyrosine ligase family protein n=1 Tax=Tetrahymena thermophila (strain SB210) TaxID=312017 RepID=Q24E48_TETTS|nr:tubulin-tyrosine ligase family protein [Tetrahymena thermophila SB210]EAS06053.1 tubulin-tyrosine ligase family protein [Tetrahymena thermophila SB210]|eukprot:XP_001026298.1 tubulin-tyrosine ligase family protein [Tetrahymena thermophila SB210]
MLLQINNQQKLQQQQAYDYAALQSNKRVIKNGQNISSQIYAQKKDAQKRALTPVKTSGQKFKQYTSPQIKSIKTMTNVYGGNQLQIQIKPQNKTQLPPIMTQSAVPQGQKKSVFIGKGNNDQLIREFFEKKGWNVLDSSLKFWTKFNFKWVQTINEIDWQFFHDGQQIVNHIQNISIIATKSGLVQTIKDFESKDKFLASSYGIHSSQFMPETFRLDVTRDDYSIEEQNFLNQKNTGLWINKPTNFNCGKGIQMVSDIKKFKDEFTRLKSQSYSLRQGKSIASTKFQVFHKKCIIQRYIESPLLLDKKKFDMRVYVFIACTDPLLVLYNPGYLRLSMNDYNKENVDDNNEKFTHLTNAAIQKKHPNFQKNKENTIWSVERFEKYVMQNYNVSLKQLDELKKKIKSVLTYVIRSAEKKLDKKQGCFELLGCDILLGSDFTPYLIEMNHNPALHLDTVVQSQVIPQVVNDALEIVMQIHEKQEKPELAIKGEFNTRCFQTLINEANNFCFLRSQKQNLQQVGSQEIKKDLTPVSTKDKSLSTFQTLQSQQSMKEHS